MGRDLQRYRGGFVGKIVFSFEWTLSMGFSVQKIAKKRVFHYMLCF